jgi:predicted DNA-binding protein
MAQPTVPVYIRLKPDLAERLENQAKREGISNVDVIRKALEAYLK